MNRILDILDKIPRRALWLIIFGYVIFAFVTSIYIIYGWLS